jgi:hypothetical protein
VPTGIQVKNDSSIFQIDENYKNFQLTNASSGTTSNNYNDGSYNYYYYDYTITNAVNPIIALYCANRYVVVIAITKSGATWTFRIASGFNDASINIYIFDVTTTSPHNYGLQIFNSAAELVYHSGNKPFRIVDYIQVDVSNPHTYTSGRTYATAFLYPGFQQDGYVVEKGHKVEFTYYGGAKNNSPHVIDFTNAAIQLSTIHTYGFDPVFTYYQPGLALVIDITNF